MQTCFVDGGALRGPHTGSVTLDGVSHDEGDGGRCVGGGEHCDFHLRLYLHQCNGGADSLAGKRSNSSSVGHSSAVHRFSHSHRLHSTEALTPETTSCQTTFLSLSPWHFPDRF